MYIPHSLSLEDHTTRLTASYFVDIYAAVVCTTIFSTRCLYGGSSRLQGTGGPNPFSYPSRRSSTPSPIAACPSRFSLARTKPRLFRAGKASQEARVACERRPFVDAFLECSPIECRGPCLARNPFPPPPAPLPSQKLFRAPSAAIATCFLLF